MSTATAWKYLETVTEGSTTYEYFYRKSGDVYEVTKEEDKSGNKTPNTNNLQPLYTASVTDLKSDADLAIPGTKDDPKSAEYALRQLAKSKDPIPSPDNHTSPNSPTYGRNELQLREILRPKLGSDAEVDRFMSRFPEGKAREKEIWKYLPENPHRQRGGIPEVEKPEWSGEKIQQEMGARQAEKQPLTLVNGYIEKYGDDGKAVIMRAGLIDEKGSPTPDFDAKLRVFLGLKEGEPLPKDLSQAAPERTTLENVKGFVAKGDFEGAYGLLENADPVTKAWGEEAFGKGCHDAFIDYLTHKLPENERFTPGDAEAAWYSSVEGNEGASLTPKKAWNALTEAQKSPQNIRLKSHDWYDQNLSGEYTLLGMDEKQTAKRKLFKGFDKNNEGVLSSMHGEYKKARQVEKNTPEANDLRDQWVNESKDTPLPNEEKEAKAKTDQSISGIKTQELLHMSNNSLLNNKRRAYEAEKERRKISFQDRKEAKKHQEATTIKEIALRMQVVPKPMEV